MARKADLLIFSSPDRSSFWICARRAVRGTHSTRSEVSLASSLRIVSSMSKLRFSCNRRRSVRSCDSRFAERADTLRNPGIFGVPQPAIQYTMSSRSSLSLKVGRWNCTSLNLVPDILRSAISISQRPMSRSLPVACQSHASTRIVAGEPSQLTSSSAGSPRSSSFRSLVILPSSTPQTGLRVFLMCGRVRKMGQYLGTLCPPGSESASSPTTSFLKTRRYGSGASEHRLTRSFEAEKMKGRSSCEGTMDSTATRTVPRLKSLVSNPASSTLFHLSMCFADGRLRRVWSIAWHSAVMEAAPPLWMSSRCFSLSSASCSSFFFLRMRGGTIFCSSAFWRSSIAISAAPFGAVCEITIPSPRSIGSTDAGGASRIACRSARRISAAPMTVKVSLEPFEREFGSQISIRTIVSLSSACCE